MLVYPNFVLVSFNATPCQHKVDWVEWYTFAKVVFVSLNHITPMFSYIRGHTEGITADSCAIWTGVQQESFSSKYWPRNNHWISLRPRYSCSLSSILSPGYNHLRNILDIPLTLVIDPTMIRWPKLKTVF